MRNIIIAIRNVIVILIFTTAFVCTPVALVRLLDATETEKVNCKTIIQPTEIIYMHPYGTTDDPYIEDLHGRVECSCVRTARSLGLNIPYGINIFDLEPNTEKIEIGTGVLFYEEGGHVAVIIEVKETGVWVDEGGYVPCERTRRFILFTDERIKGYYANE